MKRFVRCVCLILTVATILTTPAFAATSVQPKASSYFGGSSVYLNKTSDTTFEVWFDVKALRGMDELGASVIKVQKSLDGVNWTTMITYTKENNPQMICINTAGHAGCVSYIGTPGCYYRGYVVLYAKKGSGIGELYRYTSSIIL